MSGKWKIMMSLSLGKEVVLGDYPTMDGIRIVVEQSESRIALCKQWGRGQQIRKPVLTPSAAVFNKALTQRDD